MGALSSDHEMKTILLFLAPEEVSTSTSRTAYLQSSSGSFLTNSSKEAPCVLWRTPPSQRQRLKMHIKMHPHGSYAR